jgi:outer membrane usher protein
MRRWLPLALASTLIAPLPAQAREVLGDPFATELRLASRNVAVEALAWRADGEIYVQAETLAALGIATGGIANDAPTPLSGVAGLSYRFDEAAQAVDLVCESACFPMQRLDAERGDKIALTHAAGGFVNMDIVVTDADAESSLAGLFDLGVFRPGGFGGSNWTMSADAAPVRLETSWTWDFISSRTRAVVGDAIAPGGGAGAPFRFGGLQWGRDFSLDPSFVTFPLPSLRGEAATPSTVDLYVDGALRARTRVDAGPFEIDDAPIVAGAGMAQLVVTDVLGRQQTIGASFYASPILLREGLSAFTLAAGAEREGFGRASADYGRAFALGAYRVGVTNSLTAEARLEAADDLALLGGGVALAAQPFGELSVRGAVSDGDAGPGALAGIGWSRVGPVLMWAADVEFASDDFARLGEAGPLPPRRARATFGVQFDEFGSVSLTGTSQDMRASPHVETLSFAYSPPSSRLGALALSALYVDDGEPFTSLSVSLVRAFGEHGSAIVSAQSEHGAMSVLARAQSSTPVAGGWGWRVSTSQGEVERYDAAVSLRGTSFEARVEASSANGADGLRGQYETALVWIGGTVSQARPIRGSFALVDVGAADVAVRRDRQVVGRSNRDGRLLVTDLRAYEANRLGFELDDLPMSAVVSADEVLVRPAARSGALVRFPIHLAEAAEVRVVDAEGAPLREGTILVRDVDGARFPIGRDGRAYISGVTGAATLTASGEGACRIMMDVGDLASEEVLQCES